MFKQNFGKILTNKSLFVFILCRGRLMMVINYESQVLYCTAVTCWLVTNIENPSLFPSVSAYLSKCMYTSLCHNNLFFSLQQFYTLWSKKRNKQKKKGNDENTYKTKNIRHPSVTPLSLKSKMTVKDQPKFFAEKACPDTIPSVHEALYHVTSDNYGLLKNGVWSWGVCTLSDT